ncbi:MAG: molybdopterin-dependent oxidoreductase [Clostridiales Family XIII bacterium]|jgi:hypothetical protein|nr:molybdopterin-dependent oxidoreductase [Clostridiales Family XIII bacterium]
MNGEVAARKKNTKQTIIIIIIIAALAAGLAVFAALNRQDAGAGSGAIGAAGTFTVIADGGALKTFTVDELKNYGPVTVEKELVSGKHDDESGAFTGVPLESILDDAAAGWRDKYTEFTFRAEDGFISSVFKSDIEKGENVIVAYEQDGRAIPDRADGGKGPLRVIVVADEFGNRSAQMVVSVELGE